MCLRFHGMIDLIHNFPGTSNTSRSQIIRTINKGDPCPVEYMYKDPVYQIYAFHGVNILFFDTWCFMLTSETLEHSNKNIFVLS